MKCNRMFFALSLLSFFAIPVMAQNGARYALIIGNSEYESLTSLRNPVNDASDMAAALKRLGFEVDLRTNADLQQMEEGVLRLSQRLATDMQAMGIFYYAGHGVQSQGSNYLIPSRTGIMAEAFLRSKSLSAQTVLELMQGAGNSLNLVFLDACRDNPFGWARSGQRGLSVVGNQPPGSVIVYAT
ncbi:MAG: caspase family protein, partial [Spirochaetota bacterium]